MNSGMRNILSEAVLWLSVFIIALAAFFYLDDRIGSFLEQRQQNSSKAAKPAQLERTGKRGAGLSEENTGYGSVVLHADHSGHFEANANINDTDIKMLADTGATLVVLTWEDADRLGLTDDLQFSGSARTANGTSRVAPLMLDYVEVGDIRVENVRAVVAEEGRLSRSLLGMSFIGRLESFQMSGRELILRQ